MVLEYIHASLTNLENPIVSLTSVDCLADKGYSDSSYVIFKVFGVKQWSKLDIRGFVPRKPCYERPPERGLSNPFPARGRKLFGKTVAIAARQNLSNPFPARGRKLFL